MRRIALVGLLALLGCTDMDRLGACDHVCRLGIKEFKAPPARGNEGMVCVCNQVEDLCKTRSN